MPEYQHPELRKANRHSANRFTWDPSQQLYEGEGGTTPEFLSWLVNWRAGAAQGSREDIETEQGLWRDAQAAARAIPTRDITTLTAGWGGVDQSDPNWWTNLSPASPDAAPILVALRDKLDAGTATDQERGLYNEVLAMAGDWSARASRPDPWNPLGDQFFGALTMLGLGATGGLAAAPLAAGAGLTLGSTAGLLGTAGGITGMLAEPLDSKAMRMAGLAMGVAGGATSIASLLSNGLNSVGDVIKAVQKVYGTGTKAMGLINAAKAAADNPAALAQAQRQAGSTSGQQRAVGSTSSASGGTGGGAVAEEPGILSQLGALLGGLVGMAGAGMSMYQIEQYTQQLKDKYGQQEETKKLIDEAYKLALARYETYYARNEKEYEQKQTAYQDQLAKYQDTYSEQQHQWYQQQDQFKKIEGQTDEDRRIEQENHWTNRQMVNEDYNRRVAEAQQERDFQLSEHGADRKLVLESYNRRVQEADQDRQKQVATYDQQFARHTQREDQRAAETAQERGLDLNAYQQRQAIGADLRDPAKLAAGAQAVYNPLSAAARERINVQSEEEMARRGVAGGGMYSNLLAAKAFAPQEAQLWQNAMQNYMAGQQGAISAYTQQDMTTTPEYRWAQRPEFTSSPEYRQMSIPNLAGSPGYNPLSTPNFTNSRMDSVPKAPTYNPQYPGVPDATEATDPPDIPGSRNYYPEPYGGGGPGGAGGGGRAGALGAAGPIMEQLGKLLGGNTGLIQQIWKMISGGGGGDGNYDSDYGPSPDPWAGTDTGGYGGGDFPGDYGYSPYYDYTGGDYGGSPDPWANVDPDAYTLY